jgi:hypothetical protein
VTIPVGLWLVDRHFRVRNAAERRRGKAMADALWRAAGIVPWLILIALAVWGMAQ